LDSCARRVTARTRTSSARGCLRSAIVFEAQVLDGVLLRDAYLCFECRLDRFVEGLGGNSLVIGRIAAAHVDTEYLRDEARDDHDLIYRSPLLAYLHPGRTARVSETLSFPFPAGFKR
jgi:flavin reductase (DIM6/NTAB) family NADH-FMN oxidoreductase RutF